MLFGDTFHFALVVPVFIANHCLHSMSSYKVGYQAVEEMRGKSCLALESNIFKPLQALSDTGIRLVKLWEAYPLPFPSEP